MKLRYLIYILPVFTACTAEAPDAVIENKETIGLIAGFGDAFGTKASVSAEAYTDSIPSSANPLEAEVWFSTTKDTFKGQKYVSPKGDIIDVRTTITYYGPTITVPDPYDGENRVTYPPNHGVVHCVGLYPQEVWKPSSDGLTATATIDGSSDLMYADQMSGSDENALSKTRQLFNHELTWIKIRVRSTEHATGETWGKIKKISVNSLPTAKVTFSTNTVEFTGTSTPIVAFDSTGVDMPIQSTEFGSVLVSPTNSGKYFVNVECANHQRTNIEVSLTDNEGTAFSGSTKGQVFVLTLYFQTLETIDFTATLSSWEDESRTLKLESK